MDSQQHMRKVNSLAATEGSADIDGWTRRWEDARYKRPRQYVLCTASMSCRSGNALNKLRSTVTGVFRLSKYYKWENVNTLVGCILWGLREGLPSSV